MTNTIKLNKFGVPSNDDEFICNLAEQYTRGLCRWVLGYYYQVDVIHVCIILLWEEFNCLGSLYNYDLPALLVELELVCKYSSIKTLHCVIIYMYV